MPRLAGLASEQDLATRLGRNTELCSAEFRRNLTETSLDELLVSHQAGTNPKY